ncbi:MAG: sigma-70 family RNA polymerase sigma factor [Planctomycetota bacterium]
MHKVIPHKELDSLLEVAAEPPEGFVDRARELIDRLDAEDLDLEITDPRAWRHAGEERTVRSFSQQFRLDVEAIRILDREEEARLARRIELARHRLAKARSEAGLDPAGPDSPSVVEGPLPPRVNRRGMELHALRTEMVERNLYLVLINVERYTQPGVSRLDLIQEGCVSLFRAVDGFDWRRGLLFRTYAVYWLNQAFRNYLYNNTHTVRIPVYLQKALKHIHQATIRLGDAHAAPREIAAHSDLNENLISAALAASRGSFSIDAAAGEGEDGSRLRDLLVDEAEQGPYDPEIEDVSLEQGLRRALRSLGEREALVLRLRYGIDEEREHTLAEVAGRLGVSVERVRQIQVRALSKLDTPSLRRELEPFVN